MSEVGDKLIDFARWVIDEHRSTFCDVGGAEIQEKLEELGLLVEVPVSEPCGENCQCADYTTEWPTVCLRLAEGVKVKS